MISIYMGSYFNSIMNCALFMKSKEMKILFCGTLHMNDVVKVVLLNDQRKFRLIRHS